METNDPQASQSLIAQLRLGILRARMLDEPNPVVGKYKILEEKGSGAYGTVFRARDGELSRDVALKVFNGTATAETRANTMAEAQALANFQHPNIVTLYEVAILDEYLYVVMEYVDGMTLQDWQKKSGRTWKEILDAYTAAGEGLAQIHAREYVHRDFKPDNVMVDSVGNVKVADFGLARRYAATPEEVAPGGETGSTYFVSSHLSAPELRGRARATERSDQYAFCAALWLALGGSIVPAYVPRVPRWLIRAVSRGLQRDPNARWPTMRELLRVLQSNRRRRTAILLSSALFLIIGVSLGILIGRDGAATAAVCRGVRDDLDVLELERRRGLLDARFSPTDAKRIDSMIEALSAGYERVIYELCTLAENGITGAERYLAQRTCLDDLRSRLGAALSLTESDATVTAADVVTLLADIPQADNCRSALETRGPAGGSTALDHLRGIAPLRRQLAEAETLELLRRRREAGEKIEALLPKIRRAGDPRLLSRALTLYGTSLVWRERLHASVAVLAEAYELAYVTGADDIAVEAAAMRTHVLGFKLLRYDEATASAHEGNLLIRRELLPEAYSARLDIERARILRRKHQIREALDLNRAAISKMKDVTGPNARRVLRPMTGVAQMLLYNFGQLELAGAAFLQLEHAAIERYGRGSPYHAIALGGRGEIEVELGFPELGAAWLAESVEMFSDQIASRDYAPMSNYNALGRALFRAGDLTAATEAFEECIALNEYYFFPVTTYLSESLTGLGQVELARANFRAAAEYLEEALSLRETNPALDLPHELPETRLSLGFALWGVGRERERALRLIRAAEYELEHPREPCHYCAQYRTEIERWFADNPAAVALSEPLRAPAPARLHMWTRPLRPHRNPEGRAP